MKIDIHTHTKKVKLGDSENRNIDVDKFEEIIKATDVKILAITNHNHFDLKQFNSFRGKTEKTCQIWPGVELDILENGKKGHLIVIVNPKNADKLSEVMNRIVKDTNEDDFSIDIQGTVNNFNNLDSIYISHYMTKEPYLTNLEIDKLIELVGNEKRVLKEASNSISAGIYICHGHRCIFGSDVQNWDNYTDDAKKLPELRLPVENYEQFCLLLEKDDSTINTILNKKMQDEITITPFGFNEPIKLKIYNDINILFGSKGTGKTEILNALSRHYDANGNKTKVYESRKANLDLKYDLKGKKLKIDMNKITIEECIIEINDIKNATENNITGIQNYEQYYSYKKRNQISKKLKLNNFNISDESIFKRQISELKEIIEKIQSFNEYINSAATLKETVGDKQFKELSASINKTLTKLKDEFENKYINYKSTVLFNNIIQIFKDEINRKTGQPQKPSKTGFQEYAQNRICIERNINKIITNIKITIEPTSEYVGDLGEKGKLHCQTDLFVQDGSNTSGKLSPITKVKKTPQKQVATIFQKIKENIYSKQLFENITELKEIEDSNTINSINDLILFQRYFTLNEHPYNPSSGESIMILLYKELNEEKEIYLIDEPERSLGNDFINESIVPLFKKHALSCRRIIIATHDANIAVRTLPYNSIYRTHDKDGYSTYIGNPFSNNLKCLNKSKEDLDWKNISMKKLEGGKEAFGERGKIYGNT